MERLCGRTIQSDNSSAELTQDNLESSKCHFHLVQFLFYVAIILMTIFLLIYKKYFRRHKSVKGRMFRHHILVWNLTLILFLCTACLFAERLIIVLSTSNLSGILDSVLSITFGDSTSVPDLIPSSPSSASASLFLSLFTPTTFLIALCLVAYLYHHCERTHEPNFLLVHILLYLFTSILSWSTLYLNFIGGLTIFHVQVLGNIVEGLTTGILSAFLIHMFFSSQTRPRFYPVAEVDLKNVKYLHYYAPLLSRLTFFWLSSLLWLGYRQPLEEDDLGELPPKEKTVYQFERFDKHFQVEKEKASTDAQRLNLWKCMFKTLWSTLTVSGFFRLAADCSGFVAPLGIKTIVNYAARNTTTDDILYEQDPLEYLTVSQLVSNGYVMAFIILLATILQSTFSQCSTFLVNSEGIHMKIALQTLIYKKSLTLCTTKSSQGDQNSSSSSSDGNEEDDDVVTSPTPPPPQQQQQQEDDAETLDGRSSSSPGFDNGSISNLMSEDTNNIMMFFWNVHFIWAIPLKLTILMALLYLQLGYSALIGAAICIAIMIPLQYLVIAKYMSSNSKELMERCDERLRAISEILQGMKLLKLNGWELIFSKQVIAIRKKELKNLDKDMLYRCTMTFLTHISSVVVTLVTFGLYSYIEDEKLVPAKVFAGLALFNQLTVPLFMFPNTVPVVIDALVSVKRVRDFFLLPEATPLMQVDMGFSDGNDENQKKLSSNEPQIEFKEEKSEKIRDSTTSIDSVFKSSSLENIVEDEENDDDFDVPETETDADTETVPSPPDPTQSTESVVLIKNADFSWDEDKHDHGLREISVNIPKGQLIVIVGSIGSGKSSLIFALLGEMRRVSGEVLWSSGMTIAYAGQKPWMLNASVRENITFGRQYKPRRYMRVIQACALQEDINILPERDATEIGDKGINLSGGQKQRVAVARALYSDASVVILDDPLSALDVDVAHHVFDTGIRKFLLRSKRTVILVTHHLPVLHHAHHIISMEKGGRIRIQGTLADIKVKDPQLHAEWAEIMTRKEAEIANKKTAKERWSLLKTKPQLEHYRKRKGTFSHYKNLSHDIFSSSDEYHDELMTPLLRRRGVSRISRGSRTSSSSNTHPELVRMTSLQNNSSKLRSPLMTKKLHRLQSLPPTDEITHSGSSPPTTRARSGTGDKLQENMFRKLLNARKLPETTTTSDDSLATKELLDKTQQSTARIVSTVSGVSEGDEDDEDVEEESQQREFSREEREYGTIPMKVYFSYIAACGNLLSVLYLFFSIGYEVVQVYKTFWLGQWSDTVSQSADADYDNTMSYYFNIYVLLSVLTVAVSLTCNLVGKEAGANSREIFHSRMLDRVVRSPVRFFEGTPTGRIITRFSSDMAFIDRKLCISMQRFLQFVFMCVSAIAVNAIVNPWILVGAFPVIAIYFFIQRFYRFSSRELQRLEAISRGPIYSHFHETLEGLSTIRAYNVQPRFVNHMLNKIEANNRAAMFINVGNRWLSTALDYLGSIIVFLATLASMISSYLYPEVVTPSMVGLAISYILLVPVYLNQVVKFLAEVEMYMNSVERVNRYSQLEIEDYDQENEMSSNLPDKWPSEGLIEFENVSVQYGPDTTRPPIITDLQARIPPKQKVGICGRSGSGKSTLLMALFRISDISKGRILIDGVDVHSVPLIKLRTSLSIIPQENILFSGTIRFNLDPAKTTPDTDIWRALELCQMKETVTEMAGQLDAEVKDGGATFSAGQKQLLGLARAILHKSKVVIMDEATSSVDVGTERTLLEVVKEVFKDCTVLTIAHRLDTIVDGDRVLVLQAGEVIEDGNPAKLRQRRTSKFYDMLRSADQQRLG